MQVCTDGTNKCMLCLCDLCDKAEVAMVKGMHDSCLIDEAHDNRNFYIL